MNKTEKFMTAYDAVQRIANGGLDVDQAIAIARDAVHAIDAARPTPTIRLVDVVCAQGHPGTAPRGTVWPIPCAVCGSDAEPAAKPTGGARRHVRKDYVLTVATPAESPQALEVAVRAAFPQGSLLHPPLAALEVADPQTAFLTAQYEPPNKGGSVSDVDRLVARAARRLGADWERQ